MVQKEFCGHGGLQEAAQRGGKNEALQLHKFGEEQVPTGYIKKFKEYLLHVLHYNCQPVHKCNYYKKVEIA